jgi:hypothetical protein
MGWWVCLFSLGRKSVVDVDGQIFATTVEFYIGSPIRVEEVLLGSESQMSIVR